MRPPFCCSGERFCGRGDFRRDSPARNESTFFTNSISLYFVAAQMISLGFATPLLLGMLLENNKGGKGSKKNCVPLSSFRVYVVLVTTFTIIMGLYLIGYLTERNERNDLFVAG